VSHKFSGDVEIYTKGGQKGGLPSFPASHELVACGRTGRGASNSSQSAVRISFIEKYVFKLYRSSGNARIAFLVELCAPNRASQLSTSEHVPRRLRIQGNQPARRRSLSCTVWPRRQASVVPSIIEGMKPLELDIRQQSIETVWRSSGCAPHSPAHAWLWLASPWNDAV
jgi:hypothetical protein